MGLWEHQSGEVFRGMIRINAFKRSEVRLTRVHPPAPPFSTCRVTPPVCDALLARFDMRRREEGLAVCTTDRHTSRCPGCRATSSSHATTTRTAL